MSHRLTPFLLALAACFVGKASPKTQIAASLDERSADLTAFRSWAKGRETAIVDKCESDKITAEKCDARVQRFRATVDESVKLNAGTAKTLRMTLDLCSDGSAVPQ